MKRIGRQRFWSNIWPDLPTMLHLTIIMDSFEKVKEEFIAQHPEHNKKKLTEFIIISSLISNACHPEIKGWIQASKLEIVEPTGSIKFEDRMQILWNCRLRFGWKVWSDINRCSIRANSSKERKIIKKSRCSLMEKGLNYRGYGWQLMQMLQNQEGSQLILKDQIGKKHRKLSLQKHWKCN